MTGLVMAILRVLFVAFLTSVFGQAEGQTLTVVPSVDVQALVYSKGGVINACGIRVMGVMVSGDTPKTLDFSVNVHYEKDRVIGSFKMIHSRLARVPPQGKADFRSLPIQGAWMQTASGKNTKNAILTVPGEDKNSIFVGIDAETALALILESFQGPIEVGLVPKEGGYDELYELTLPSSSPEFSRVMGCLDRLVPK
jgi:hypothetical protein